MEEALKCLEQGDSMKGHHVELVFLRTYGLLGPKECAIDCSKSIYPRYRYVLNKKGKIWRTAFLKMMKLLGKHGENDNKPL
jgi:hypothetical protein